MKEMEGQSSFECKIHSDAICFRSPGRQENLNINKVLLSELTDIEVLPDVFMYKILGESHAYVPVN